MTSLRTNTALPSNFYDRDAATVAKELLGKLLCRRNRKGLCIGRIVEAEAYLSSDDPAAHSVVGINRKNASMFGPPGRAYVYTIHARQCFNIVTEPKHIGSAVLIRAVEPLAGLNLMQLRRRTEKLRDLCRGPARLTEAFSIGRDLNGWNLTKTQRLWIAENEDPDRFVIRSAARIGVTSAHDLPLRFFFPDNEFVSGRHSWNS